MYFGVICLCPGCILCHFGVLGAIIFLKSSVHFGAFLYAQELEYAWLSESVHGVVVLIW